MYTVYYISSQEGYFYVGQTQNLEQRLQEHNAKKSFWTKRGNNWILLYSEVFSTRKEAMQKEKYFKTGKGREFLLSKIHQRNEQSA